MYECYFCKLCDAPHENHHLMMKVACLNKISLHLTSLTLERLASDQTRQTSLLRWYYSTF